MKISDVVREVTVDGHKVVVSLGDTVWWFAEAQTSSVPSVATVKRLLDNNMVDLSYIPNQGNRLVAMAGVRLIGDETLKTNRNARGQGCWCPRGTWESLALDTPKV